MRKLFDFNGDGKCSFGEQLLGFGLMRAIMEETAQEEEANQLVQDFEVEFETDRGLEISEGENRLEQLRDQLSELEDEMIDLEIREPEDMDSPAYLQWEELRDGLQEQIDDLECEISEAELERGL